MTSRRDSFPFATTYGSELVGADWSSIIVFTGDIGPCLNFYHPDLCTLNNGPSSGVTFQARLLHGKLTVILDDWGWPTARPAVDHLAVFVFSHLFSDDFMLSEIAANEPANILAA
jgi:hypothetical protein